MKKFAAIAASALLATAMIALPACSNDEKPGEIPGDYKELTTTEEIEALKTKLGAIDSDSLFGLSEGIDSFGLALELNESAEVNLTIKGAESGEQNGNSGSGQNGGGSQGSQDSQSGQGSQGGQSSGTNAASGNSAGDGSTDSDVISAKESLKVEYKIKATPSTSTLDGAGELTARLNMTNVPESIAGMLPFENFDYQIKARNDAENLYLTLPDDMTAVGAPEDFSGEMTLPIRDYTSAIFSIMDPDGEKINVGEYITLALDYARQFNVKVYTDETDGLKVKLSADKDSVKTALGNFGVTLPEESVIFNKCVIELYFAIDQSGVFSELSALIDVDVDVKFENNELPGMPSLSGTGKVNATLSVKKFDGEIPKPTEES